jgi:hypothetical protein
MAQKVDTQLPSDPMLRAIGAVAVRAGHLEYGLKLAIKSLLGLSIQDMMRQTDRMKAYVLRERIIKAARAKFGEGPILQRLQALLDDAAQAALDRNGIIHDLWADSLQGKPLHFADGEMTPTPTVADVEAIASRLDRIGEDLNRAPLHGWLREAID